MTLHVYAGSFLMRIPLLDLSVSSAGNKLLRFLFAGLHHKEADKQSHHIKGNGEEQHILVTGRIYQVAWESSKNSPVLFTIKVAI